MKRQVMAVVWGAMSLVVAGISLAGEAAPEEKKATPKAQPSGAMGMRVYVDPETGALVDRPVTPEQERAAESDVDATFNQDSTGLRSVTNADGSTTVFLDGRFQMSTQVHTAPDGSKSLTCDSADHAGQAKHSHAPVSTAAAQEGAER